MPSSHLILCCPLLLLPPIPPHIRVFSNESTLRRRWPNYWSFSFSIIPSKEIPGLISFRMDWLDLLAVQGTPKSLLQHHSYLFRCSYIGCIYISKYNSFFLTCGMQRGGLKETQQPLEQTSHCPASEASQLMCLSHEGFRLPTALLFFLVIL